MLHISKSIRRSRLTRTLVLLASASLLLVGVYLLIVIATPAARTLTIDPENNTTTKKLSSEKPKQAWLYIPKIDINVPYGTSESDLYSGSWWRKPQNGNPEDGGNFVLSGHRFVMSMLPNGTAERSPFYNIDKLTTGDKIYVDYKGERYTYTVSEKKSVKPNAVEIEDRTDEPQLTLYSCTLGGSSDGRDVVIAQLTKQPTE